MPKLGYGAKKASKGKGKGQKTRRPGGKQKTSRGLTKRMRQ